MRHAVGCVTTVSSFGAALPLTQLPWHSSRPPASSFEMSVVKTRTLVEDSAGEGATARARRRSPHIHIHPYTLRMPCVHGASPEEMQTLEKRACTRPLLLCGDSSAESDTGHFTQVNKPLGTLYTAQTRKPAAFAAAHVPMSDAVGELHLSARDEARTILNGAAVIQNDCPGWVHPESAR